jgi:hypothetical protein
MDPRKKLLEELTKKLLDNGQLIEAGFKAYQLTVMPQGASPIQVKECRLAFFAGAQHLFASIMTALDPDKEPTEDDMRRMSMIHSELEAFVEEIKKGGTDV